MTRIRHTQDRPTEQRDPREPAFITSGHICAFKVVQFAPAIELQSCWINGEPGVAIVLQDGRYDEVLPLFVAPTASMRITLHSPTN